MLKISDPIILIIQLAGFIVFYDFVKNINQKKSKSEKSQLFGKKYGIMCESHSGPLNVPIRDGNTHDVLNYHDQQL